MALRSVHQQVLPSDISVETIIVDDASPDQIDPNEGPSVRVVRHNENKGAAAARNTGVAKASGDLIAFLDSDDVWLPNKLANQLSLFDKLSRAHDPDLLVVGSGFYDPDRKSGALRARIPIDASREETFASGCWFAPGSTVLMSRKAFDIVGPQDETMRRLEDLDWFIRFGKAGGKYFCTGTHDVVIRPSGNAPFDSVMIAVDQLTTKYGPRGSTPLEPRSWNRLAAYLSLEKAVAHLGNRQLTSGALEIIKTLLRKPRLRPSLERFWVERNVVPADVEQTYKMMLDSAD